MNEELIAELVAKPCPFCDGEAIIIQEDRVWIECADCPSKVVVGPFNTKAEAIAAWNTRADALAEHPFAAIKRLIHDDPDYAWSWQCNLAVPIMDAAMVSHADANRAAALIMAQMFDCDITLHPHYPAKAKQGAQ